METLLAGIRAERVATGRLTVNTLSVTGRSGPAVLFVHGNVSSSLFWQPTMLALPEAVIEDSGHGPHLDQPERFLAELCDHLSRA